MAGDTFRDAFRAELATVRTAASILWPIKDTVNTATQPNPPAAGAVAADAGYLELEFMGGGESQYTFGAPGANFHREEGQVTIRVVTKLRAGVTNRDLAETYAAAIRSAFRMRRFAAGSRSIRITSVAPMGGGIEEGGGWVESVALGYELFNVA